MRRVLSLLFFLLVPVFVVAAEVPSTIGFQGFISNTSGVAQTASAGSQSIILALYDSSTSTSPLYKETQGVNITNGYFSVEIGAAHLRARRHILR